MRRREGAGCDLEMRPLHDTAACNQYVQSKAMAGSPGQHAAGDGAAAKVRPGYTPSNCAVGLCLSQRQTQIGCSLYLKQRTQKL